jgi:cell division protein FtsQ
VSARSRARSSVRGGALALPSGGHAVARLLPTRGSLLVGLALFACAAAAFVGARETAVFAVDSIAVRGAPPAVERDVAKALAPLAGVSLLKIDGATIAARLRDVPWVASAGFDRSFPHTLTVTVRPERPVAVLRGGARAWLLSARGRVLQRLPLRARPELPRVWAGRAASPTVGTVLGDTAGGRAARTLAPLPWLRFPARVASVSVGPGQLTFVLRSGIQLRLGDASDLRLKLAIARRVLARLGPAGPGAYLDVSVPERPVALVNPQVEG